VDSQQATLTKQSYAMLTSITVSSTKLSGKKPIYRPDEKGIQPPTDEQCKILVGGIKGELSVKVQLSAEKGLRPCGIMGKKGLKVRDIHTNQHTVTATSAKGCNAKPALKISEELTARIKTLITQRNLTTNNLIFTGHERRYGDHYRRARNKLANKLQMPELKTIRLYDLRHYYVTKQLRKEACDQTVICAFPLSKPLCLAEQRLHLF
jgi:hypothetical protein